MLRRMTKQITSKLTEKQRELAAQFASLQKADYVLVGQNATQGDLLAFSTQSDFNSSTTEQQFIERYNEKLLKKANE